MELQGQIAATEAELVFEQCVADETCLNQEKTVLSSVHWQHISKDSVINVIPVNHPMSSKFPENQPKQRLKESDVTGAPSIYAIFSMNIYIVSQPR